MSLVAYPDSDGSDDDTSPGPAPHTKPTPKPSFRRVVDPSHPGKIKLTLPALSYGRAAQDKGEDAAPPAKRPRTGGGAFSGFNAMLPAPKKPAPQTAPAHEAPTVGRRGFGKGLGVGVSLRTGPEPAFQRSRTTDEDDAEAGNHNPAKLADAGPMQKEDFRALFNLPPSKTADRPGMTLAPSPSKASETAPPPAPATKQRFMPLSVAHGKKKKKKQTPAVLTNAVTDDGNAKPLSDELKPVPVQDKKLPVKQKISLFSASTDASTTVRISSVQGYQPLLYGTDEEEDRQPTEQIFGRAQVHQENQEHPAFAGPQLTNIASELNLSAAERRQLFGRKGQEPDLSARNLIEFNTDTEYAHNERLRQQGDLMQHNALKSISGTGKNSLRSLINVASTQKDALEEHFAAGRRNRKEAGNRVQYILILQQILPEFSTYTSTSWERCEPALSENIAI